MKIAIIPVWGDSKKILRKSICDFCGKSMTTYTIEIAARSGIFKVI